MLAVGALFLFNIQVFSQPAQGGGFEKVFDKMKLTGEQRKNADNIQLSMEKEAKAQQTKAAAARVDLQRLLQAENPDKDAIEKKISDIANLEVQRHMIRINSWFAINKMLNPDQKKEWKKTLEWKRSLENTPPAMQRKMRLKQPKKDSKSLQLEYPPPRK